MGALCCRLPDGTPPAILIELDSVNVIPSETLMNTDLSEEEMRRALFGEPASVSSAKVLADQESAPDVVFAKPVAQTARRKVTKAFTPRLRVTLMAGNEFEGKTFEIVHEADTLSKLQAELDAVKAARKKYRYVEVVSVKSM